jgi:hypothetical protein
LIEFRIDFGLVVMVVVIVMPVIVMIVVVVAMVFVVPVSFVNLPTLLVVVVVGVGPVGAGVGWPLPSAGYPDVATTTRAPVPIGPGVAFSGHGRSHLIADCWRWGTDIDLNLTERRNCQDRCGDERA